MSCIKKCFPKIKEYVKRYGLAELFSYTLAILGGTMTFHITNDYALSGLIVIIGDNVGYYGTIFIQELISGIKGNLSFIRSLVRGLKNMGFDFGIPQILETVIVYPLLLTYVPQLFIDYPLGVFVAMTLAVLIFYMQTIILYEIRKKYFKN